MKKTIAPLLAVVLTAGLAQADDKPAAKDEAAKPQVVKFDLVTSGHFIVKAKVNGKGPYNLIFDTGAPTTLVTPSLLLRSIISSSISALVTGSSPADGSS